MPVLKEVVLAGSRVGRTQCIEVIEMVQEEILAKIGSEDPL